LRTLLEHHFGIRRCLSSFLGPRGPVARPFERRKGGLGPRLLHSQFARGGRRFATFAFFVALIVLRRRRCGPAVIASSKKQGRHPGTPGSTEPHGNEKHGQELFGRPVAGLWPHAQGGQVLARWVRTWISSRPTSSSFSNAIKEGASERGKKVKSCRPRI